VTGPPTVDAGQVSLSGLGPNPRRVEAGHSVGDPAYRADSGSDTAGTQALGGRRLVASATPWLLAAVVVVWALVSVGTAPADIARYALYLALGLAMPGTLLLRALSPAGASPRTLAEEVGLGALLGLAVELGLFVAAVQVSLQHWVRLWPVVVVLAFLSPPLRGHWLGVKRPREPRAGSWLLAGFLAAGATTMLRLGLGGYRLPPAGSAYYQDLTWHLSIVHAAERAIPPALPQVAGETLQYHWFAHAQMAAASLAAGVPEATLLLRLWPMGMLVLAGLAAASLARRLGGPWWVPPTAAGLLVLGHGLELLPVGRTAAALNVLSPSQELVVPLALAAAAVGLAAIDRGKVPAWIAVALLVAAASGAKPTAVPVLACGAALATTALALGRDRRWRPGALLMLLLGLSLPLSRAVSGSDGGVTLRFGDLVEWMPLYHLLTGEGFHAVTGPFLPEGVADLSPHSLAVMGLLAVAVLVPAAGQIVPLMVVARRPRGLPVGVWFCAGCLVTAWGAYLLLSHPALSQAYFFYLGVAFAAVLAPWVVGYAATRAGLAGAGRAGTRWVGAGVLLGVVAGVVVHRLAVPPAGAAVRTVTGWTTAFGRPLLVMAGVWLAVVVVGRVARRGIGGHDDRRVVPRGAVAVVLLAALLLGAPAAASAGEMWRAARGLVTATPVPASNGVPVTPGGAEALAWLDSHAPQEAVVATNRHCATGPARPGCRALAFNVSALGGRQVVLEGWGYTSPVGGLQVESPWPQRLRDNDAVFTDADPAALRRLAAEFGVTWLVADTTAGPVSPGLDRLAAPRFHAGAVTVYEVR
jgi:hypothetical protein